jgi:hypothetical protein
LPRAVEEVRPLRHAVEPHQHAAQIALRFLVRRIGLNGADVEPARELVVSLREKIRAHLAQRGRVVRIHLQRELQLLPRQREVADLACHPCEVHVWQHRVLVIANGPVECAHRRLALPFAIRVDPLLERARSTAEWTKDQEQHGGHDDDAGRGDHPHGKPSRRRHDLHGTGGHRWHAGLYAARSTYHGLRDRSCHVAAHVAHERRVELEERSARGAQIGLGRLVSRVLETIARRLKLGERIGLLEVDELSLARLANQRLTRENGASDERPERGFHRAPGLEQVGGDIFRAATSVQPGHRGARRVELEARTPLCRGGHFTIRRSPATALPRMKLSASLVGM